MPILDQAAMEASLDNDYGTTRGSHAPDAFEVALFNGDPSTGGTEVSALTDEEEPTGYARVALASDDFAPCEEGIKAPVDAIVFPAPTAEWETVTHWGLYDPAAGVWWDAAPLTEPLEVTEASDSGPEIEIAIFYGDNTDIEVGA